MAVARTRAFRVPVCTVPNHLFVCAVCCGSPGGVYHRYIRKYALNSVTMRGSRLKVEDDPMEKKKKLGQRAGEDMEDDNVILALLGGGAPTSPSSKAARLKVRTKAMHPPVHMRCHGLTHCRPRVAA